MYDYVLIVHIQDESVKTVQYSVVLGDQLILSCKLNC